MTEENTIPSPPTITDEELEKCRRTGDYCPVLFEWYKYVGSLCNYYACIQLDSPAIREIPPTHYYVLVGLLNRCSRYQLAELSLDFKNMRNDIVHEGKLSGSNFNYKTKHDCAKVTADSLNWID